MQEEDRYDLLIIGAGISGLAMARFYLEAHPNARLTILERDDCVGGTWSQARLYDHFWTQWAFPYAQFSDLDMEEPPPEDMYYGFFKAKHTSNYLNQYADHHDFNGSSIRDRIQFRVQVKSVSKSNGKWEVLGYRSGDEQPLRVFASKLAIASGRTSIPSMPTIPGSDSFGAPITHVLDFGRSAILSQDNVKKVSVVGSGKSAGDMVYTAVKAGKTVSWIVRPGGRGPAFYAPVEGGGPYRGAFDIGSARMVQAFSPSIWASNNFLLKWLHESKRGVSLITKIWTAADNLIWQLGNFKGRENKGGFDKLEPLTGIFWNNGPGGLLNRKDFYETIAANVQVYYDHVSHLSPNKIHLRNGQELECDALLCGTGWQHSFSYLSDELCAEYGLRYPSASPSVQEHVDHWTKLDASADRELTARFPLLANPPPHFHPTPALEPLRLYNAIAPTHNSDRDLVVIGQLLITNYFRGTECQAMWATAYMDGHLRLPDQAEQEAEVAQMVAWSRRRYLSEGDEGTNFTLHTLGYCDRLLEQLGLKSHRGWWWRDLFVPTTTKEMKGLKDEYLAKYGGGKEKDVVKQ